jgi:hypothetical protein
MGFRHERQTKLYGEEFELLSDPIVLGDDWVLVEAIERSRGGQDVFAFRY